MLSTRYPSVHQIFLNEFHGGLKPLKLPDENHIKLIIKLPKEYALTAKFNNGFKIYLVPVTINNQPSISLITAFFDNPDEPLAVKTPLFLEDHPEVFREMLLSKNIEVYFFDENNFEYLGYCAHIDCPKNAQEIIKAAEFKPSNKKSDEEVFAQLNQWFGHRQAEDDGTVLSVVFDEPLYPEDIVFIDARMSDFSYTSANSISHNTLERVEPGEFQERDIANLFSRVFSANQIYLNPLRMEDSEEISDILIVGDNNILFVQAKDSPNTERILRNSVKRKKSTTLKHLDKALAQVSGAVKYAKRSDIMRFLIGKREFSVPTSGMKISALIVVKELFTDEYVEYTKRTLAVADAASTSCIPLEYTELHLYTMNLHTEDSLFCAMDTVFSKGRETGRFPRLLFRLDDDVSD